MKSRSTIRWRLTLTYGIVFALAGCALLIFSNRLVDSGLLKDEGRSDRRVIDTYQYSPEQVDAFYNIPTPSSPTHPGAKKIGDVIEGIQGDIRTEVVHESFTGSLLALGIMVIASLGLGWLMAGRALRPVDELTRRARSLSERNLHERLALDGPDDELKELGDTLDAMLGRLESAFESQRSFAANVSHELRTPLSVIRAEADVLADAADTTGRERRFAASVRDAADRTESLLDSLLALARSESTMNDRAPVDLADLAGDSIAERIDAADRMQITVELELGTAIVDGDHWLLERLVANLIDNAITHNAPGGWVRISADHETDDQRAFAVLRVANTGDPLSTDEVTAILEPFHRADRNRPGYGLGMTIVQAVVQAHDGTFTIEPRAEGGINATVRLPLAIETVEPTPPAAGPQSAAPDLDGDARGRRRRMPDATAHRRPA